MYLIPLHLPTTDRIMRLGVDFHDELVEGRAALSSLLLHALRSASRPGHAYRRRSRFKYAASRFKYRRRLAMFQTLQARREHW